MLLHGSTVRASNKKTVRTRFRFSITTAEGHTYDFGSDTNEERTLWIAKLEQAGVNVESHFSLPAMAVVVLDEFSKKLVDESDFDSGKMHEVAAAQPQQMALMARIS